MFCEINVIKYIFLFLKSPQYYLNTRLTMALNCINILQILKQIDLIITKSNTVEHLNYLNQKV